MEFFPLASQKNKRNPPSRSKEAPTPLFSFFGGNRPSKFTPVQEGSGFCFAEGSCMGNCFGRGSKPKMTASVNTTAKESETRSQNTNKPSKFEGYWSSSTFDMDNNTFPSSSIGTSTVDPQGVADNSGAHSEFINHGLILWNQTRQRWIGNKKSENLVQQPREPLLNWNVTYESLHGSDKPFPRPIPLSEMVDFLVDTWEQEGLYD